MLVCFVMPLRYVTRYECGAAGVTVDMAARYAITRLCAVVCGVVAGGRQAGGEADPHRGRSSPLASRAQPVGGCQLQCVTACVTEGIGPFMSHETLNGDHHYRRKGVVCNQRGVGVAVQCACGVMGGGGGNCGGGWGGNCGEVSPVRIGTESSRHVSDATGKRPRKVERHVVFFCHHRQPLLCSYQYALSQISESRHRIIKHSPTDWGEQPANKPCRRCGMVLVYVGWRGEGGRRAVAAACCVAGGMRR